TSALRNRPYRLRKQSVISPQSLAMRTLRQAVLGTAEYIAPEQVRGEPVDNPLAFGASSISRSPYPSTPIPTARDLPLLTAASRTPPWPAAGWECRDRRLSRG